MNIFPFNIKTDYSLLSSLIKIDDLINFCLGYKIDVCAVCDNNLSGAIEFYNKCKNNNIKPVIGLEIIFNEHKICLYAKNENGFKNLLKLHTLKEKNNIDKTSLIKYSNDLICILEYSLIKEYNDFSFYNDLYISYTNKEEKINALIVTENVIYNKEIKMFKNSDLKYLEYLNELGGLNSLLHECCIEKVSEEIINEYISFCKLIDLNLKYDKKYIPVFDKEKSSNEYLKKLAHLGLKKRLNNTVTEKYINRLNYELDVIEKMGFTDYFLIVYDYVLYAKKNNILVGPGRGSAAGSLVCYAIGITNIDPIKYDLLFERFLNKDRISMPDIDIDFDSTKRDDIINYVKEKYGKEKVAVGLTYNTLKAKLILREISKILKIDNNLFEKFIKNINGKNTLLENLQNPLIKKFIDSYPEIEKLYKISIKLEGLKKNISTHAAGVVICSENLDEIIPIRINNDTITTGYTMDYLENLGILKMDFLGLKNLTVISNILNQLDSNPLNNIDLADKLVIDIFTKAKTDGIFQYETYSMKKLLEKLKPSNFNEIVAAVALVRPGPSDYVDEYIKSRDTKKINYLHPSLESILKETYGVILYQEQIIKILVKIGNFSNSEADIIRRAISKKKEDKIKSSREKFIQGALANSVPSNIANQIFDKIAKFASFGFNKSHSVAYALIGYQMAYLKVYEDKLFLNELLKDSKNSSLTDNYLNELKQNGTKIFKPDVNYSEVDFEVINNGVIMPLSMIKGITKEISKQIVDNKPYVDYFDFCIKNKNINNTLLDILIYAGALRSFKLYIKTMVDNKEIVKNYAELDGYGEKPILKNEKEYDEHFILSKELSSYGFYVTNHPASKYKDPKIMKLSFKENNLFKNINLVVIVESIKRIKTKKGDDMAFVTVSDETGKEDLIIFKEHINLLNEINYSDLVFIGAKVSKSFDKVTIIINSIKKKVGK